MHTYVYIYIYIYMHMYMHTYVRQILLFAPDIFRSLHPPRFQYDHSKPRLT